MSELMCIFSYIYINTDVYADLDIEGAGPRLPTCHDFGRSPACLPRVRDYMSAAREVVAIAAAIERAAADLGRGAVVPELRERHYKAAADAAHFYARMHRSGTVDMFAVPRPWTLRIKAVGASLRGVSWDPLLRNWHRRFPRRPEIWGAWPPSVHPYARHGDRRPTGMQANPHPSPPTPRQHEHTTGAFGGGR